ncbi:hypothetical protein GA0115252_16578 [Streptomyces sp. DfronAA-171]|nr:hypothetical protein GA0115252_16578 [Streptomyces sp. DfronAA-171]
MSTRGTAATGARSTAATGAQGPRPLTRPLTRTRIRTGREDAR